jgi:hypothetical protein
MDIMHAPSKEAYFILRTIVIPPFFKVAEFFGEQKPPSPHLREDSSPFAMNPAPHDVCPGIFPALVNH